MNSKNIRHHLKDKMRDWYSSIDDINVRWVIRDNAIITGGAIVSLLTGEPVNDYDVYFKTKEACQIVAEYYAAKWNDIHVGHTVEVEDCDDHVSLFIRGTGIVCEKDFDKENPSESSDKSEKYRPVCLTSNAITLSDKIQVVIRFCGDVDEIHKNYDFAHCTCSWSSWDDELRLPTKALECIINKELYYIGSKYPLCSLIRTRKYLQRGYHIDAGQYVKMAFQLSELDLKDPQVLEEQLVGVDSAYFQNLIVTLKAKNNQEIDSNYVIELIDQIF